MNKNKDNNKQGFISVQNNKTTDPNKEENDKDKKKLSYEEIVNNAITGSLAYLIFGQTNKKSEDIKSLIGSKNNDSIYNYVKNIRDSVCQKSTTNTSKNDQYIYKNIQQSLNSLNEKLDLNNIYGAMDVFMETILEKKGLLHTEEALKIVSNNFNSISKIFEDIKKGELEKTINIKFDMLEGKDIELSDNFKNFMELISKINFTKLNIKEDTIKSFSLLKPIMKEMSSIGEQAKVFENNDSLFSGMNSFYNAIDNLSRKSQIDTKNINNFGKSIGDNIEPIKNLIKNISLATSLEKDINEIKLDAKSLNSISSFISIINNIPEISNEKEDNLERSMSFIENSFITGLESISQSLKDKFKDFQDKRYIIESINDFLESITDLGDIGIKKQFNMVTSIFTIKNFVVKGLGSITQDIEKVYKDIKINQESITSISLFMDLITKIPLIGIVKRNRMLNSVNFIKDFLTSKIGSIGKTLSDTLKDTEINNSSIVSLNSFFEMITSLGSLSFKDKLKMYFNIKFIKIFLMKDIKNLILDLADVANISKASFKDLLNIKTFLEYIISLGDLKNLEDVDDNFSYLSDIIKGNLYSIIDSISKIGKGEDIDKYKKNIDNVNNLIKSIYNIVYNLPGIVSMMKYSVKLSMMDSQINSLNKIIKNTNKLEELKNPEYYENLNKNLFEIGLSPLFKSLKTLDDVKNAELKLIAIVTLTSILSKFPKGVINKGFDVIDILSERISTAVNKLNGIKDLDKAEKTIKDITEIVAISAAILLLGGMTMKYVNVMDIITFTACLSIFIFRIVKTFNKSTKNIKKSIGISEEIIKLIIGSAAILILGSLFTKLIDITSAIQFTFILAGFMAAVILPFKLINPKLKKIFDENVVNNMLKLIIASAGILVIASLVSKFADPVAVLEFLGMFAGTLAIILGIYWRASKLIKKSLEISKSFLELVSITGGILLGAALISKLIDLGSLISFAGILALFVLAICGVYWVAGKFLKGKEDDKSNPMYISKEFMLLVAVSGAVMILGGLLTKFIKFSDLITFALNLGLFMLMVCAAYGVAGLLMKHSVRMSKEFIYLVAVSAAIMIIGAFFMRVKGLWADSIKFTVVFGVFILAMCFAFSLTKHVKAKSLIAATIMVVVAAATLLIGAYYIEKHGWQSALRFASITVGFMLLMTLSMNLLGKMGITTLLKGILGMVAICGIVFLMGIAFGSIVDTVNKIGDLGRLINSVILMGAVMAAVGLLIYVIGSLLKSEESKTIMLTGGAVLAGIVLIIWMTGKAFQEIAKVAIMANKAGGMKKLEDTAWFMGEVMLAVAGFAAVLGIIADGTLGIGAGILATGGYIIAGIEILIYGAAKVFEEIAEASMALDKAKRFNIEDGKKVLLGFMELCGTLAEMDLIDAMKIELISGTVSSVGNMISKISESIKDMATLKIPIYNGKEKIGYRELNHGDFELASKNIKEIISTLGKAVIELYEENPAMFEYKLIGDNPFTCVVKSSSMLGNMISKIANGVKDMAILKVPIYKGTEVVGYRELNVNDFAKAAINTKLIITTLGSTIIDLYNGKVDGLNTTMTSQQLHNMFDDPLVGDSPFAAVINASSKMGTMISNIAKGVKDMSELLIADEFDPKTGKGTHYRKMIKSDFIKAASNVGEVILFLGKTIIDLYNGKDIKIDGMDPSTVKFLVSNMFHGDTWFSNSPFTEVVNCSLKMSDMITKVVKVVQSMANLKFQKYVGNGKFVDVPFDRGAWNLARTNIYKSLTITAWGVCDAYIALKKAGGTGLIEDEADDINDMVVKISELFSNIIKISDNVGSKGKIISGNIQYMNYALRHLFDSNGINSSATNIVKNSFLDKCINDYDNISNGMELLTDTMDDIINIVNRASSLDNFKAKGENNPFIHFGSNIIGLNNKINQIDDSGTQKLKSQAEALGLYVRNLNSINTYKVTKFTNMISSLNGLSDRLGKLDSVTNVLAKQITSVLNKLTSQLASAQKTIKDADKLQVRRHQLIVKAQENIKTILKNPLNVTISQNLDNNTGTGVPSNGSQDKSDTGTQIPSSSGGGTGSQTDITESEKKENKSKKHYISKSGNDEQLYNLLNQIIIKLDNKNKRRNS